MSEILSSGLTLTIPSEGDDNWAASIKTNCFSKISSHDHTGGGKGVQIATDAIANLAVTEGKIAAGAVTTDKLGSLSIGASQIASDAITTAKILNGNVSLVKLANIATDRLIGRDTAGSGAPEEISLAGGLEFSGSGAVQIAADGVTTAKILDGNITGAKLASGAAAKHCEIISAYSTSIAGTQAAVPMSRGSAGSVLKKRMAFTGVVTHLAFTLQNTITAGDFTILLYKDDVYTASFIFSNTVGIYHYSASISPIVFVVGTVLDLRFNSNSLAMTGGAQQAIAEAYGYYD
jgi:hypothetical protein